MLAAATHEVKNHEKLIMHPSELSDTNMAYLWGGLSTILFFTSNFVMRFIRPECTASDPHRQWKWRNTANSFLHSSITGVWSLLCIWEAPEIGRDLISVYTKTAHAALSVSAGYFIYDLIDMMISHRKRSSFELMIHHILVILCFGLAVTTRYFLGFCIIGLLVEVNSVFLHARQLMHIQNMDRTTILYRLNCYLNIGTFIVFRILTLGALTVWIFQFSNKLTTLAFLFGGITLPVIFVMNIVLFMRILNTDIMKQPPGHTKLRQLLLNENEDWKHSEDKES